MTLWLDYWTQYLNTLKDAPVETPVEHPNTHNTFLRGGGYNCRVNRSGAVVKTFVAKMMKTRDFLTLSEAHQYIGNLRYIPNTQLVAYPGEHQAGEVRAADRDLHAAVSVPGLAALAVGRAADHRPGRDGDVHLTAGLRHQEGAADPAQCVDPCHGCRPAVDRTGLQDLRQQDHGDRAEEQEPRSVGVVHAVRRRRPGDAEQGAMGQGAVAVGRLAPRGLMPWRASGRNWPTTHPPWGRPCRCRPTPPGA